jgi:hypothetical protein
MKEGPVTSSAGLRSNGLVIAALLLSAFFTSQAGSAQSGQLQQIVQQARAQLAQNQQRLGRYSWQMTQTVSVRGTVKQTTVYQVELGPNGTQLKSVLSQSSSGSDRKFGLRHRIQENYQQYATDVGALAQSYAQLNPSTVQQLYAHGRVSLRAAGTPGYAQIVIHGYVKPGDAVALTLHTNPKALVSYNVSSYLSDPSDGVTMQAIFGTLPDGTRYISKVTVNGETKNLTITQTSANFQPR